MGQLIQASGITYSPAELAIIVSSLTVCFLRRIRSLSAEGVVALGTNKMSKNGSDMTALLPRLKPYKGETTLYVVLEHLPISLEEILECSKYPTERHPAANLRHSIANSTKMRKKYAHLMINYSKPVRLRHILVRNGQKPVRLRP
jgi:hypothetical protein